MNNLKLRAAVALAGIALFGLNGIAQADSTDDLLKKLHDKGILNDQEYNEFNNTRDIEQEQSAKEKSALNKGKIKIGSFIDNATFYGDVRVRYEHRDGEDSATPAISEDRDRGRYKITFGVKTEANNFFYSDLAFVMGARGRSDNATFGASGTVNNGANDKETLFVKRAMIGWHGVDWLTVEAGRVANPLYTTSMVWDPDLTFEGLAEKLEYTVGNVDLFANLTQSQYLGDKKNYSGTTAVNTSDRNNNFLMAFQGGAKFKLTDTVSAKAALTYTTYTHDKSSGTANASSVFTPGLGSVTGASPAVGTTTGFGNNVIAINDLRPIEIPFEVNYKANDKYTLSAFGDFVHNLDGSDRQHAACTAATTGTYTAANRTAVCNAGTDSNAWMLGVGIKSVAGKTAAAGDWEAKVWWQEVGMYSVDPNAVDSDFMDSRVNMKGVVFKAGYNVEENVVLNLAAGHASRKDKSLAAAGTNTDLSNNIDDYNLYQLDLTYKF